MVVSIRRSDGEILFNPSGEATIAGGDLLIAIGHAESLMKLAALAKGAKQSNVQKSNVQSLINLGFRFCLTLDFGHWTLDFNVQALNLMRILVTGGSGYLGTHVRRFFPPTISRAVPVSTSSMTKTSNSSLTTTRSFTSPVTWIRVPRRRSFAFAPTLRAQPGW